MIPLEFQGGFLFGAFTMYWLMVKKPFQKKKHTGGIVPGCKSCNWTGYKYDRYGDRYKCKGCKRWA